MAPQSPPPGGQRLPVHEVSRAHSTTNKSVALLWANAQPHAPDKMQQSQPINIHMPVRFEPTISADERPQTYALDRAVTGPAQIIYEGVSKIFLTDAVKIIKLTTRPIGRHHPRSSSLPHVETGPTVSCIFGTLPGSPFLS
jgi:hypothetical protein